MHPFEMGERWMAPIEMGDAPIWNGRKMDGTNWNGRAKQVEANHLIDSLVRLAASVNQDQKAGDDCQVHLDLNTAVLGAWTIRSGIAGQAFAMFADGLRHNQAREMSNWPNARRIVTAINVAKSDKLDWQFSLRTVLGLSTLSLMALVQSRPAFHWQERHWQERHRQERHRQERHLVVQTPALLSQPVEPRR